MMNDFVRVDHDGCISSGSVSYTDPNGASVPVAVWPHVYVNWESREVFVECEVRPPDVEESGPDSFYSTRPITAEDLRATRSWSDDPYTEPLPTGPTVIHVGPGRYDEQIELHSWTAATPIQFIEPAPWYAPLGGPAAMLAFGAVLVWAWTRQRMGSAGP